MDFVDNDTLKRAAAMAGVPVESLGEMHKYGGDDDRDSTRNALIAIALTIVVMSGVAFAAYAYRRDGGHHLKK
jgi:hypothetical protein